MSGVYETVVSGRAPAGVAIPIWPSWVLVSAVVANVFVGVTLLTLIMVAGIQTVGLVNRMTGSAQPTAMIVAVSEPIDYQYSNKVLDTILTEKQLIVHNEELSTYVINFIFVMVMISLAIVISVATVAGFLSPFAVCAGLFQAVKGKPNSFVERLVGLKIENKRIIQRKG